MVLAKKAAGEYAVDKFVSSNQIVGLGTGSTAYFAILRLAQLVKEGKLENIICVATSRGSHELAEQNGLTVLDLDDISCRLIDVAIDGADEIDRVTRNVIKGRGGALLREKLVETGAKQFIVIADDSKVVDSLGRGCLPVEINRFGYLTTVGRIQTLLGDTVERAEMRRTSAGELFVTDNENYIVDLHFKGRSIQDPVLLNATLQSLVGVIDTGLFLKMEPVVVLGKADGSAEELPMV